MKCQKLDCQNCAFFFTCTLLDGRREVTEEAYKNWAIWNNADYVPPFKYI